VSRLRSLPLIYWGTLLTLAGLALYLVGVAIWVVGVLVPAARGWQMPAAALSSAPTAIGLVLVAIDLIFLLPYKRRTERSLDAAGSVVPPMTVALTAYNDELSIADAVEDFRRHPLVQRVIVVSNNSTDRTMARAREAGAVVINEPRQGYGWCVYRCLTEALAAGPSDPIVLCEGDRTFRASDLDKLAAYLPHAPIVNGTRIVEQLRAYHTQLSTGMYYGNFFVGKLLELKHFGQGTFTDVGTTYKMIRRDALEMLLPRLDPSINLEFNAHLLDRALSARIPIVECPVTFHPRVGMSKGGNVNNRRAIRVGLRMMIGLSFGWRWLRDGRQT
jgi:glycosyltransferase involved in cell wall biosynthesis